MIKERFKKKTLNYKPCGRRDTGRPRARWRTEHGIGDSPIPRREEGVKEKKNTFYLSLHYVKTFTLISAETCTILNALLVVQI